MYCTTRTNKEVGTRADVVYQLVAHLARCVCAVDEREHAALAARFDQPQDRKLNRRGRRDHIYRNEGGHTAIVNYSQQSFS